MTAPTIGFGRVCPIPLTASSRARAMYFLSSSIRKKSTSLSFQGGGFLRILSTLLSSGLYRRLWIHTRSYQAKLVRGLSPPVGLPPRPEEINLFLFIIAERCINTIVSLSSKDLVRLFSHHGKNCVFYITADIIRTSKFFFFHAGNLLPAIQSNQLLIGCMTFLQIIQMLFMNI